MRLQTILNSVEKYKGFVCTKARLEKDFAGDLLIVFEWRPRRNSRPVCSGCKGAGPIYDHQPTPRQFEFVPLWNIPVVWSYTMRRVDCRHCGVKVERVPWATGNSPLTRSLMIFLAGWARRLSWNEVATVFKANWHQVWTAVSYVVSYGLTHRNMSGITAIGVDEIQYAKGHQYLTLVYQLNAGAKRLLYIGKDRTVKSLLRFFVDLGKPRCRDIEYVCSDMWRPYLRVIRKKCADALHILDRFHIVANLNKVLSEIRAQEARQMKREGYEDILKGTRYCFLKNPQNLTPGQDLKLKEVLQYNLKSVRAYLLKESFQGLWKYNSPYWAEWYLKKWCTRAMRSRLKPMKKFAQTIRDHQTMILNWFTAKKQYSAGVVEGFNRKVNLVTRKSYGFRQFEVLKTALFHALGDLPEPETTHKFC